MQILGILIDKPILRVALIEKIRGRSKIIYLNSHPYNESENVKQLYTKAFKGKISSTLSAQSTIMHPVEVNIGNSRHLDQALSFQTEAASHLDKNEIISAPYILARTKEKTKALIFTATKGKIREHLDALKKLSLDPDTISSSPLALVDYFKWKIPTIQDGFFIDLGSEEWTCVCMEKGHLKKFHSIEGGVESLLEALWEDRKKTLFPKEIPGIAKQIDLSQLKSTLNPHLFIKLKAMKQEMARIIYAFNAKSGKKPLFFTGRTDAFSQMEEFLKEGIEELLSPCPEIEIPKEEKKYAIPIGLGVGQNSLQFRKDEFFPQKTWKSLGAFALSLSVATLFIGGSLIEFSNHSLRSKSKKMVSFLETSLKQWDNDLAQKIFIQEDEEEILRRWDKAVTTHLKQPTYMGQYPKVSEVLSWLYQHPLVQEKTDPIKIKSVRYQLTECPRLDTPRDPYQAKLEIEFETKSSLNARKFHEEIHEGEAWVDNKEDVQWEVSENTYRTSFYLKKENPHVS